MLFATTCFLNISIQGSSLNRPSTQQSTTEGIQLIRPALVYFRVMSVLCRARLGLPQQATVKYRPPTQLLITLIRTTNTNLGSVP